MKIYSFKQSHPFDERKIEADRIRAKYPDRIPIICERAAGSSNVPNIDKKKYLVPNDLTLGQFVYVVRKRLLLNEGQAIFIFVNGIIPPTGVLIQTIYENHYDKDGFLYMSYSGENVFG